MDMNEIVKARVSLESGT